MPESNLTSKKRAGVFTLPNIPPRRVPAADGPLRALYAPCSGNVDGAHHWIIDTPSGSVSEGRCRDCNETRTFRNSLGWEPNQSLGAKLGDWKDRLFIAAALVFDPGRKG